MGVVIEDYRKFLSFKKACALRDKCFSVFDENCGKKVTETDWLNLMRIYPVTINHNVFRDYFNDYKDGIISPKEFYLVMKNTCDEINKKIDENHQDAINAYCDFFQKYHTFFEQKASDTSDDNIKLLCSALCSHQIQQIFMEFLEQ